MAGAQSATNKKKASAGDTMESLQLAGWECELVLEITQELFDAHAQPIIGAVRRGLPSPPARLMCLGHTGSPGRAHLPQAPTW